MKIERAQQCQNDKYTPMIFEEFSVYKPEKRQFRVNATIKILENIDSKSNIMVCVQFQSNRSRRSVNGVTPNLFRFMTRNSLLQFRMFVSRCSMSMMHCEEIETFAVPDVCEKLLERGVLWTPIFNQIKPPLKCPFKRVSHRSNRVFFLFLISIRYFIRFCTLQGTYSVNDGKIDMTLIRHIPLDPEKLNVNLTLYEYIPDEHDRRNSIKRQLICLDVRVTITLSKNSNITMLRPPPPPIMRSGARPKN